MFEGFEGFEGKTITLDVSPRDTVADVKAKIQEQEGCPTHKQLISVVGGGCEACLEDEEILVANISSEETIVIVYEDIEGGMAEPEGEPEEQAFTSKTQKKKGETMNT
eukprot:8196486-Heterocapsa_arctica.AAC.1